MSFHRLFALHIGAAIAFSTAVPARSNGDTFFNSMEIPGNPQYVIFGNVKDVQGHYLQHVTVTVRVMKHMLEVSARTDVIGHFRTPDVGREIHELGYQVDPSLIIVSAAYPGYHIAHRQYRGKYHQSKGAIEVDFTMAKNG